MKTCTKCGVEKPLGEFVRRAASKDGLSPICRSCAKAKARAHREANVERLKAKSRAYRERVKDRPPTEARLAWLEKNRDRISKYKRAWHAATYTPEKGRAAYDRKKATDPEGLRVRGREITARYRAKNPYSDRERELKRAWTRANKAKLNAIRRRRRETDEQYRARGIVANKANYVKHREKRLAQQKPYRDANRERIKAAYQRRMADPAKLARKRARNREHFKANKHRWRAYGATRKAAKLRATPPWADPAAIATFYANAPPGHEVDHIIPLRGKNVCGLHWHGNLQYLAPLENRAKRNYFDVTAWPEQGRLACPL